jgi:two-component system sensor histidine kinase CpxA
MKLTWTLPRKVLALAVLNVLLILAALGIYARLQFRLGAESLLLGPVRDRIQAVAGEFNWIYDTEPDARSTLLDEFSRRYGAEFLLVDPGGWALLGVERELPEPVLERMHSGGGPPPRRGPGKRGLPPPREPVFLVITRRPTEYWAGVRIPLSVPGSERGTPAVLLIRSATVLNSKLFFDARLWLGGLAVFASVSLACWLPFLRRLTRDIARMEQATAQIAEGRFVRIETARTDELGQLGEQISRMSARLEDHVHQQKRFLGDIAHELCAPIARIQFALGILEQRAAEGETRHIERLRDEIQEMSALVNELLSFSKASIGAPGRPLRAVDVAAAVSRAVEREGLASAQVSIDPGIHALADEDLLVRAIANLLRNAERYAGDAGPVQIHGAQRNGEVSLTVSDHGPGLPTDVIDRVFEPFFRLEPSRDRDSGGVGLGLAIVQSCVQACHGAVACRNRQPHGLEVTIRLKASDDPRAA